MFRTRIRWIVAVLAVSALVAAACSDDDSGGSSATPSDDTSDAPAADGGAIVFNGEGNNLNAFSAEPPFEKQTVITNAEDDPENGLDINAQICFFPDDPNRFIAGEDTGQPDPPQGWGIFDLSGSTIGDLSAEQVGKLTPTYQGSLDNAENYGCGFLSDGRILTTDIGNQAQGDGDGQLIVWFPPFDSFEVSYCKVDVAIATAGGISVDEDDNVYTTSARPPTTGVYKYSGEWPTDDTPEGGCDSTDATGAPMTTGITKELFIAAGESDLATPNAIVPTGTGGYYVSSVFNGVINEYDADGTFVRTILKPPAGEMLGETTFSTGTPLGLAVGPDGTLYYADIGITVTPDSIGPGDEGTLRRITFVAGEPQAPEIMGDGLAFPDGVGVYVP